MLILKGEVKGTMIADWLVFGTVELAEERVRQCLFHSDSLLGVYRQHLAQQINGFRRRRWELLAQRHWCLVGQFAHEALGLV